MTIIPAIDIIDGKCVRLTQGNFHQKTIYHADPVEVARQFEDAGFHRLHLVDLDGAKSGSLKNWQVLEKIASNTSLLIDYSGGIGTEKDVQLVFDSGAAYAAIGSIAVKDETTFTTWLLKWGAEKFIIGADTRDDIIVVRGWTETTALTVFDLLEIYTGKGVKNFFCTDTSKDGALNGPATSLYKRILDKYPSINLTASGGVSSIKDLEELRNAGCKGVIVGKAIYENRISLDDLIKFGLEKS